MTQPLTDQAAEVAEVLRNELARLLGCPAAEVDLAVRLTELPGIDSMRLVQTVVNCEKHWNISLDEDELVEVRTGEDLAELIAYTIGSQAATA
ncbi:acyl carrier protein [Nocardia alni]|uniref:acyl carrier protein n=1 Tax=Nocardia alni TaxID=2815723 RepID=UPI001C20F7A6|nr:acyl carrier protein [Nocardia alni]